MAEAFWAAYDDLAPWMPWATPDWSPEPFLEAVAAGTERAFLIRDASDRVQGTCGMNDLDPADRTANLGYWRAPWAAGQGYATRATRLVLVHGLRDLELERIEIVMSVENEPSRRVPERLGLSYEGIRHRALHVHGQQHDAHVFAAFREDLPRLVGA